MNNKTLWYTRCPLPTAFSIAIHRGILAQQVHQVGGEVQSLRHSADEKIRLSHFTHTYPGMIRQGGHIPPLWSRSAGRNIRLLGLSWTNEAQLLLTLPDKGIEQVSDLKGKRLAVPIRKYFPIDFWRATVLKGYLNILASANLSLADVILYPIEITDMPFSHIPLAAETVNPPGTAYQTLSSQRQEAHALIRGDVDAIFSPGHYGIALNAFVGGRILSDLSTLSARQDKVNNSTLLAFTVDADFLDRQPEIVVAALQASLEAANYAKTHPAEVARIIAAESGNPEELISSIFGRDFNHHLIMGFTDEQLDALQQQNHFLFKHGFISRQVPIDEWIAPEPLKQAQQKLAQSVRSSIN